MAFLPKQMVLYFLNTKLSFGKHQGKTISQVLDIEPSYIKWCIVNLNHFCMLVEVLNTIQERIPEFKLNKKEKAILNKKIKQWIKVKMHDI